MFACYNIIYIMGNMNAHAMLPSKLHSQSYYGVNQISLTDDLDSSVPANSMSPLPPDFPVPACMETELGEGPEAVPERHSQQYRDLRSIFNKKVQKKPMKLLPLFSSTLPNALHSLPESRTKFIDPVEIIHCDSSGGIYHNPLHGITIRIPEEAIPYGEQLEMSTGVCLYGNFSFIDGFSPVSAMLWLCSKTETVFLKPIEVIIPHFMECRSKEDADSLEMQFMKANHRNSASEATKFFIPADGRSRFHISS